MHYSRWSRSRLECPKALENSERNAGDAGLMCLIGGHPCGGTSGIVVCEFDMRQVNVPVVRSLIDDHREHLSHDVIHALYAAVTAGMIGAC